MCLACQKNLFLTELLLFTDIMLPPDDDSWHDSKGSDAPESSGPSAPDTAPRHIGADKKRSSMGVSLKSDKKSKEDDDTKRKAEFRRRWEGGANPSSMEEFRWVKEFLG